MRIEREIMINLNLTHYERQALATIDALLLKMQTKFTDETKLQSVETGELLEIKELSIVRGVLGMIRDNSFLREFEY